MNYNVFIAPVVIDATLVIVGLVVLWILARNGHHDRRATTPCAVGFGLLFIAGLCGLASASGAPEAWISYLHAGSQIGLLSGVIFVALGATFLIHRFIDAAHRDEEFSRRLATSERNFRAFLDNAPAIIAIRDRNGRYEFVNRTYERIYGYTNEEISGKSLDDIFSPEHAEIIRSIERRVIDSGEPVVEEQPSAPLGDREGTLISVRFPLPDENGHITRIATIATDITSQKHVEQALRTAKEEAEFASRAKSEFLAKMSHELRTPLNAIIGFSQVIKEEVFGPIGNERYHQYVNDIGASGEHLLGLISDLLDISKIEAGEVELMIEPQKLSDIVREVVTMLEKSLRAKRHQLSLDIPDDLPDLEMDGRSLRQILVNVVTNAIKFTTPDGKIKLSAAKSNDTEAVVTITDTGMGIRADELEEILSPFYQAHDISRESRTGAGLGLTIVDSLVAMHGGRMSIESQPGIGTSIRLHLPIFDKAQSMSQGEREFEAHQRIASHRLISMVQAARRRRNRGFNVRR